MKMQLRRTDTGNVMICAMCTILIISLIGANVLMSSVAHYNVAAKQLKAWKEALYAAEAGGDIGLAEVRKVLISPGSEFSSSNWITPAVSPAPTPGPGSSCSGTCSWSNKNLITLGQLDGNGNPTLFAAVSVDKATDSNGLTFYRVRAKGTAKLLVTWLRVGMDDAIFADGNHFAANATTRGVGDSLLRKIDFKYDHFKATYGDGDGSPVPLATVPSPQITRRIELVAVQTLQSFTGSLKVTGSFNGPGSAGVVDSYDSQNGAYTFVANNPASPYYADSRNGDVSVATKNFSEGGPIYGNVTTNGGNVKHSGTQISGTIDNNVPFTIPPLSAPQGASGWQAGGSTITPSSAGSSSNPVTYQYSSFSGVTINPYKVVGVPQETYVTIYVNGDISSSITVSQYVTAQIYFTGNLSLKGRDLVNNNVDKDTSLPATTNTDPNAKLTARSRASHLQLYAISPTNGTYNSIAIDPPGDVYATIYAPYSDMSLKGNPDVYGAIVSHNFNGNGNTGFHYDKELANLSVVPVDFQVASYVEDVR